jgi:lipopolysaccharide/colanic/teichoic acid biosynthesis glycosyltransferase
MSAPPYPPSIEPRPIAGREAGRLPSHPLTRLLAVVPETTPPPPARDPVSAPARASTHASNLAAGSRATCPAPDWDALAPRGFYARTGRPLFLGALVLAGLPVAALLAALVALINACVFGSPRRIFFLQPRVGHRGRIFQVCKFRTMRAASRDSHASWTSGEDELRVTRFGRFLRSSHLDELPQIWNVLRGDMDLIGPRPEMVEIEAWAGEQVPGFEERLAIRPGLTGLAQVTQGYTRNDTQAYAEKLRINREYLRTLSFGGDVLVVLRTIAWMARGRGWSSFRLQRRARGAKHE